MTRELNPSLKMSYKQKQERALQKKVVVLNFLASGEVWTTLAVVAELLKVTERTAQHLLARLVEERLVAVDLNVVPHSNLKIYGITEHGLSVCESTNPACKSYSIGRTNPAYVTHHIQSQLVRIRMEQSAWTGFVPGKLLYGSADRKGQIVPDFLAVRPDGLRVAGEIERYCKSPKRQADVFAGHLKQIIESPLIN